MFDTPSTDGSASTEKEDARALGMFLDMPLCRFSWCILPAQQVTLNIWQPQYTLMFQSLLAEPGPHYYFHVLLPGGADSLGKEGYELRPGTKSSLVGTLMRVSFAQREQDSRLTLVVQGLARGVVLRPTQDLPYSRGDVLLLPDAEALREAARAAAVRLRPLPSADALFSSTRRRMVAAAAVAMRSTIGRTRRRSSRSTATASRRSVLSTRARRRRSARRRRRPSTPRSRGRRCRRPTMATASMPTSCSAPRHHRARRRLVSPRRATTTARRRRRRRRRSSGSSRRRWRRRGFRILQRGAAAAGVGRDVPVPSPPRCCRRRPTADGRGLQAGAADERLRARYAAAAAEEGPPGAMRATA